MPKSMISLSNEANVLFHLFRGCLNGCKPQYTVCGREIMPAQVIKVPNGTESSLSRAMVKREEPVSNSTKTVGVTTRAIQKNNLFFFNAIRVLRFRLLSDSW